MLEKAGQFKTAFAKHLPRKYPLLEYAGTYPESDTSVLSTFVPYSRRNGEDCEEISGVRYGDRGEEGVLCVCALLALKGEKARLVRAFSPLLS